MQNRWTDVLAESLDGKVGVLNLGIGGNCVVQGGLSEPALKRFDRDILSQRGVSTLVIFEGVNDIGGAKDNSEERANVLIDAYKQLIAKAKAKGMKVYLGTITPFKGNGYFTIFHEAARQYVNEWIRTSNEFDGVIDFDALVRDENDPAKLKAEYSDDWLHLNPKGYEAMGKFAAEKLK
jgi:lysophospholipase L1-like esterase